MKKKKLSELLQEYDSDLAEVNFNGLKEAEELKQEDQEKKEDEKGES